MFEITEIHIWYNQVTSYIGHIKLIIDIVVA